MDTLSITTVRPQIQIENRAARLNIRYRRPRLVIRQSRSTMRIERRMPRFKMDWQRLWAEQGNPSVFRKTRQRVEEAYAETMRIIAGISARGDRMMHIEEPGNTVAQIAADKALADERVDINVASIPPERIPLEWEPGYIRIEWTEPVLEFVWDIAPPEITVEPHAVEVHIRNNPKVMISVSRKEAAPARGRKVDRRI